jgi:hypothetical protein
MRRSLYQPYFYLPLFIALAGWSIAGAAIYGRYDFAVEALVNALLVIPASLAVFAWWRVARRRWLTISGSYFTAILISPVIWLSLYALVLWLYAAIASRCCEDSWALHVTAWSALTDSGQGDVSGVVYWWLLAYVSFWIFRSEQQSIVVRWITGGVLALTAAFTVIGGIVTAMQT